MHRRVLFFGPVCLLGSWTAGPAFAQSVPTASAPSGSDTHNPQESGHAQDIVITARKRSESAQRVPITITALDGSALTKQNIKDLFQAVTVVPGAIFSRAPDDGLALTFRGLGTAARSQAFEQSIALFTDGVFLGKTRLYSVGLFDIDRIEFIKGTQSTLLGKNASLGAISIITPQNALIRLAEFEIFAFGKQHERAAALLPTMLNQGEGFGVQEIGALKFYLAARKSGRAADADRASAAILSSSHANLRLDLAVKALASLGRIDQAFALLEGLSHTLAPEMDLAPANPGTSFLFAPETAPLRADSRFWTVANQQGLTTYWMKSGKWPDFCGKEQPLKQCQASAAKAQAGHVG